MAAGMLMTLLASLNGVLDIFLSVRDMGLPVERQYRPAEKRLSLIQPS